MTLESPTASALRIVERDLEWSLLALRELVDLIEEAASHLASHDRELASRLRTDASRIAYGRARGPRPLVLAGTGTNAPPAPSHDE